MDYVAKDTLNDLIPANVLPVEEGASQLIGEYNQLVLQRNKLLSSAGTKNKVIFQLDTKIQSLKQTVTASLIQLQSSLAIKNRDVARQKAVLGGKIAQIPTQRKLNKMIANKICKDATFMLLQKRGDGNMLAK